MNTATAVRLAASAQDVLTMAATLYGEARGSTHEDRIACAWVMRNRAQSALAYRQRTGKPHPRFGDGTILSACRADKQFSCWNAGDPNRPKLDALMNPQLTHAAALDRLSYLDCLAAALEVITGRVPDPTKGSTHYHTTAMGWPGGWGERQEPVAVIGAHTFYNTVK